jgi:dolichyl-diphosphooligosaccharide--protein glycosyltransferase
MNITYSKGDIQVNKREMSTDNGILMNSGNSNVTWEGQVPYCVIIISNGQVKKQYLNEKNDFCVIMNLEDKKAVVFNKEFENSTFTKLSIEKSKSQFFEQIYEKSNIVVWKSVN